MANLKITIEKVETEKQFTVRVRVTNDVGIESIIESMKEMFEVEMFSAKIKKGTNYSSVEIQTENEYKCEIIKNGMMKTFRQRSGLDNINNN